MKSPEIDRSFSLQNVKRKSAIAILMAVVLVSSLVLAIATTLTDSNKSGYGEPEKRIEITYTAHDPIVINGNSGFTNDSGVVWGSGTAEDPYIIENWEIDAFYGHGILISNADVHFIVRNCFIYHGETNFTGIYLLNCKNGTLPNNICSNNACGITIEQSEGIIVSGNDCSWNNVNGILLYFSNMNYLMNNTFSNNILEGISL